MSIASEITRLQNAKAAIKAAIEAKGVEVGDETLDEYADLITRIEGVEIFKKFIDRSIESVVIPNECTVLGSHLFSYCRSLINVEIPNSVETIEDCVFEGCTSLSSIILPPLITIIPKFMCSGCTKLTSINIPDGVTEIKDQAFNNAKLNDIILPNGLTKLGSSVFISCKFTNVTIPSSVTAIGNQCFNSCKELASIYVNATNPPTLGSSVFRSNASGRKIYVPAASVNDYKAATNWSEYANDIEAIPTNS